MQIIITIILFIIFFILLVVAIFTYSPANPNPLIQQTLFENSLENGWCSSNEKPPCNGQPVTDIRGKCNFYSTLTSNVLIVDSLSPTPTSSIDTKYLCDNGFIKALQKNVRVCQADECLGKDGKIYTRGQQEFFYSSCLDLNSCNGTQNAVILNYYVDPTTQKLSDKSTCLTIGQNQLFIMEQCSQVQNNLSLTNNPFPILNTTNIFSNTIYKTSFQTADQLNCLSSDAKTVPCSSLKDIQTFMYIPNICEIITSNGIVITNGCYPQQFVQRLSDVDLANFLVAYQNSDVDTVISILNGYSSLSFSGNQVILQPYIGSFCTTNNDSCTQNTAVLKPEVFANLK